MQSGSSSAAAGTPPHDVHYDLTHTIGAHLDRHLVLPLLEFLKSKKIYPEEELLKAQLALLEHTNMVDFETDIFSQLHGNAVPIAEDTKIKRAEVVKRLKELTAACKPLTDVIDNTALVTQLTKEKNYTMEHLQEHYNVPEGTLQHLYHYAKFLFDCGNYSNSAGYLSHFQLLTEDPEKHFNALWGKLAAEILMQNWATASEDLKSLREAIDAKERSKEPPLQLLQQRTWLIHWSLFVFFNHPNGRNGIVDMFFNDRYLNTIQTTCPHVLRYLTTAVITNKRRRNVLADLVRVIQQEGYTYRDPITEFLEDLYLNFDFEGAQHKLRECEAVLMNDFFLVSCRDEFIENARLFIFETYCRIHKCIDISMLAAKLNMGQEAAEHWIVNLIRGLRLDAKIDSAANQVVLGTKHPSIYQQVIERTKGLSLRSSVLANNLSNYLMDNDGKGH